MLDAGPTLATCRSSPILRRAAETRCKWRQRRPASSIRMPLGNSHERRRPRTLPGAHLVRQFRRAAKSSSLAGEVVGGAATKSSGLAGCSTPCATAFATRPTTSTWSARRFAPPACWPRACRGACPRACCWRRCAGPRAFPAGWAMPTSAITWRRPSCSTSWAPNVFYYHGYNEIYLRGHWVKATVAFNRTLCEKARLAPLDFDGVHDSIYHPFDLAGHRYMEYLHDYGAFADVPYDDLIAKFRRGVSQPFVARRRRRGAGRRFRGRDRGRSRQDSAFDRARLSIPTARIRMSLSDRFLIDRADRRADFGDGNDGAV